MDSDLSTEPVSIAEINTVGLRVRPPPRAAARVPVAQGIPPGPPPEGRHAGPREDWFRTGLVGIATALMAAGITAGVLLGLGMMPRPWTEAGVRAADGTPAGYASTPAGRTSTPAGPAGAPAGDRRVADPPPETAGALVLDNSAPVTATGPLLTRLSYAEQFFPARGQGVDAVYQVSGSGALISYIGANAALARPAGRLTAYLRSLRSGVSPSMVAAGPDGGAAECAAAAASDEETLCGWATATTFGVLRAPAADYDENQLAGLMRQVRPYLEH